MLKVSVLLRWANVIVIFFTFLSYLAPYVSPVTFWPLAFFGLIYPWLLLFNIIFIIIWAIRRKRYFLFSLGCILLGWGNFRSIVGLSLNNSYNGANNSVITAVSFNAHSLEDFKEKKRFATFEELSALFDNKHPSIACFQEFTPYYSVPRKGEDYVKYLTQQMGLKNTTWRLHEEIAIFTIYPILHSEARMFNESNGFQYVDVDINGATVRIFNMHLQSNAISTLAEQVATEGDLQHKKTWLEIKGMMGRFKSAVKKRAIQAEEVAAEIAKSPYPVILCGDFNDIPQSYTYHTISKGLQDSFRQRGQGIGFTYAGRIPALRIDYILTSPRFKILSFHRRKTTFSDHCGITSDFLLLKEN